MPKSTSIKTGEIKDIPKPQGNIYLGMGSNLGNRLDNMRKALVRILVAGKIELINASSLYETEPWGNEAQPRFFNAVVEIHTTLAPRPLWECCRAVEADMGSEAKEHWGPRKIDLDVLFYQDRVLNSPELTIPHPQIPARRFVLAPLSEIAAGFVHPQLKKDIQTLLKDCPDTKGVRKIRDRL